MMSAIPSANQDHSSERDNFCFPIPDVLENDRVKLVPFIPSVHADKVAASSKEDRLWKYLPYGPFGHGADLVQRFWEPAFRGNPSQLLFVAFDKTKPDENGQPSLAAIMGYINTAKGDLWTEIGFIVVFPEFQRTHVTSNAIGLLMHYALDLPEDGGLGLRRVQWQANKLNAPSLGLAQRLGFKMEGILRWARVLPPLMAVGTNGSPERKGDPRPGHKARDTAILAICWDDWEDGGREKVDAEMARTK
ncbi:hypothetical protein VKT23_007910 [Stygiomarasmius scandens]|uniref:N-acetyltransferase domain-containing protein n=1 Tax=Marasmiellus scandens TaxID=2682957 RepID=A0ABR1JLA0_9AGAR